MNILPAWWQRIQRGVGFEPASLATLADALLDRRRYDAVFDRLERRAAESSRLRFSYANHPELTLAWVLDRRAFVLKWMLGKLHSGSYQVYPARESMCEIAGKRRVLYRLEWPDRILQTVLAQVLSECWDDGFSDSLFSYRKGRSAMMAVQRAARFVRCQPPGPVYVLKRDVKSYGDSIPHDRLFMTVQSRLTGADSGIIALVRQFVVFDYVSLEGQTLTKTHGLPTGMPLNCVLENVYLEPLDARMSSLPGVSYMRYGDDVWLATTDPGTAVKARQEMNEAITERALAWHPDKCLDLVLDRGVVADAPEGFAAASRLPHLGVVINRHGHIDIPPEKLRAWRIEFKKVLHRASYMARRLRFSREEKLRQLVRFANRFLVSRSRHIPRLDYLLAVVTDDQRFIDIDRWVAETILAVHHGRYARANFRKTPYLRLKELGLHSLYLRRQDLYRKAAKRARARTTGGVSHG